MSSSEKTSGKSASPVFNLIATIFSILTVCLSVEKMSELITVSWSVIAMLIIVVTLLDLCRLSLINHRSFASDWIRLSGIKRMGKSFNGHLGLAILIAFAVSKASHSGYLSNWNWLEVVVAPVALYISAWLIAIVLMLLLTTLIVTINYIQTGRV